jgi:glycosyltransferase involved in cell wall biosynthesis
MLILFLAWLAFSLTLINVLTVRMIKNLPAQISDSVDLLIPMRNESRNVKEVLDSVMKSKGLLNFNIYALDDNSFDDTGELISKFPVHKLSGRTLPEGWLGKNFACQQLSLAGDGQYLVFLDADVRITENAVSSSIKKMQDLNWDFISPYPRQLSGSFIENLIQPLLQWSWLASVPLRLAERFPNRSMTIANGQFFIVKRSAYESIGRHETIKSQVLDDLELARALIAKGFKGAVADGSKVAKCRMYQNGSELVSGYTKSLWKAFGGILGTFTAVGLLVGTGVLPLLAFNSAYLLIVFSRVIVALKVKSNPIYALLHPLSILLLCYLLALSIVKKQRGTLQWRGRRVN